MSDALLTEISKKLSDIAGLLKAGAPAAAKASTPAPGGAGKNPNAIASDTTKTVAEKKAAVDAEIARKKAAKEAADKAAAAAGKKGSKHTIDQVREMIRKVAADVDKQSAKDILKDDGGGVEKITDLKPELYDAVFEACEVLLGGEGKADTAAPEEDDFA